MDFPTLLTIFVILAFGILIYENIQTISKFAASKTVLNGNNGEIRQTRKIGELLKLIYRLDLQGKVVLASILSFALIFGTQFYIETEVAALKVFIFTLLPALNVYIFLMPMIRVTKKDGRPFNWRDATTKDKIKAFVFLIVMSVVFSSLVHDYATFVNTYM